MKEGQISWTAMGTAAMRAIESEKPANVRICYDPLARELTATWFYHLIRLLAGYGEQRTHGALTFIVCRYRYINDYLHDCIGSGIRQVVILGAGLDSRAYQGELVEKGIKTFEVDYPASQMYKVKKIKKVLKVIPENITYIPIDFEKETLDKLLSFGFNRSLKTLFIWEGVTPYLDPATVNATLGWVSTNGTPGSSIVFDYQYRGGSQEPDKRDHLYEMISGVSKERRSYGIEKGRIVDFLEQSGFINMVDVNADKLKRLYCTGPNKGRTPAANYAIVHAEVAEKSP